MKITKLYGKLSKKDMKRYKKDGQRFICKTNFLGAEYLSFWTVKETEKSIILKTNYCDLSIRYYKEGDVFKIKKRGSRHSLRIFDEGFTVYFNQDGQPHRFIDNEIYENNIELPMLEKQQNLF